MKSIKIFRHDLHGTDISVGNIVPIGNSLGYYRIVKATDSHCEVKEVNNPYSLLYYVTLMKFKYGYRRFMLRLFHHA